ncbi:MAG: VWA domain-containing protein [Acidobacteriota bacterium]
MMSVTHGRFRPYCLALSLALVALGAGPAAAADDEISVLLVLPAYGEALFGEVEVEADIYAPDVEIERVLFFLDGEMQAVVGQAPWKAVIDAGQENVEHVFEVLVQAVGGLTATSSVHTPRIKTDEEVAVELQQLYVAVERNKKRVLNLQRGDFTVVDNGQRQDLVTFESGEVPFTATLLVDASTSMKGDRLRIALEGVAGFVDAMRELDQAKLMLFSDRLLYESPFTSFGSVITLGLSTVEAGGGTALSDHLYLALKKLEERQGRRVIVVLSDGVDVESALSMDHVRWRANQLQPVIYWLRTNFGEKEGDRQSMWRSSAEHREELDGFEDAVVESGGRIETITQIEQVGDALKRILDDLRNQYVLGYYPDDKGGRHKVDVRVAGGAKVRARGSYSKGATWDGRN